MKRVVEPVDEYVDNEKREHFHELMRSYTDIFSKNFSTDYIYSNLKRLIKDENTTTVAGDKGSSILIMNKNDYVRKI